MCFDKFGILSILTILYNSMVLTYLLWFCKFIVKWSRGVRNVEYRPTPPSRDFSPAPYSPQNFWLFPNFSKFLFPTRNFTISLVKMDLNIYQKNDFYTQNVVKNAYLNEFTNSLRNWSINLNFCRKTQKNATSKNKL